MCASNQSGKYDPTVALAVASNHREAYHHRIEHTSKTIFGSLTFFAIAVGTKYAKAGEGGLTPEAIEQFLEPAVWAVMIVACVDIVTAIFANEANLATAHEAEDEACIQVYGKKLVKKKGPFGGRTRKFTWAFQLFLVVAGGMLALAAISPSGLSYPVFGQNSPIWVGVAIVAILALWSAFDK